MSEELMGSEGPVVDAEFDDGGTCGADGGSRAEAEAPHLTLQFTNEEIANRFSYHKPKDDQPERYEQIRDAARSLAYKLNELCPPSRELSLAMTKLEECVMHANSAIARRA